MQLVEFTIETNGKQGAKTDNAPFWLPNQKQWKNAGELEPGMWLRTSAGTHVQITAVKTHTAYQRIHNLTVDTDHTYHVFTGNSAFLVHNCEVALGIQKEGNLAQFAADRGLKTFTHLDRDSALAEVREVAMENPETIIHVTMDGFKPQPTFKGEVGPEDLFEAAYKNGKGDNWWTTEREMAIIVRGTVSSSIKAVKS